MAKNLFHFKLNKFIQILAWTGIITIWIVVFYFVFYPIGAEAVPKILRGVGFLGEDIKISGTGSMYPTFPKGKGENNIVRASEIVALSAMKRYPGGIVLFGKRYLGYTLSRYDIVSFENFKTREISTSQHGQEAGFVKRIIGLPGDRVEIRDGFVKLNGFELKEPYTARPRSTFGGTAIPDCNEMVVPEGKLFVLGDNRVASSDSRYELGLIDQSDVDHALAWEDQKEYRSRWRDPSDDDKLVTQPTLVTDDYVQLLNQKRKEAGLSELKIRAKLIQSANKRGEVILKYDDLSFEATRSGYTMDRAIADAGYRNITWGEAPTLGYYTGDELIENSFQFPKAKQFLLRKDFQDIGVAAVLGEINGCPTQVIVQHFGGYVPPNYDQKTIDSWGKAFANLQEVKPSWEQLVKIPPYYDAHKSKLDRLLDIMNLRIDHIQKVVERMKANQWLSDEEKQFVDDDKSLYEEQNKLSIELNGQ